MSFDCVYLRKLEEMELMRERQRLAALTLEKERAVQQLTSESLQKTADMLDLWSYSSDSQLSL